MKNNTHFLSYLAQFFLEGKMFQTKLVETTKTHILNSIKLFFFRKQCCLWRKVEKYGRAGSTTDKILRKSIARWIPKATNTSSEYVKLIAIPQQQWLSERASTLRYMYIDPLVSLDLVLVSPTLLTTVVECATIPRPRNQRQLPDNSQRWISNNGIHANTFLGPFVISILKVRIPK